LDGFFLLRYHHRFPGLGKFLPKFDDRHLLFLEIREYMGNLYMRRLTGAVGGFTRHKVPSKDSVAIMNIIAQDPYKYAKIFGQHYSCCGSCGAELTDPVSRDLQLGPECRKKFGR
jgi:hypothetical protein